ncbi:ATP-binding protein [Nonomuraea pusilla]|uniref:Histidine kinase-like ATPase domain-containing protein n=1 Tax=Nonomuraea pusilla TaxID=46177 RepID=A0A1H8EQ66_9ACTN|nr:ATP-binding protein [Nonomuraea pusilla]SEN21592.1 Histidine kinase-like ATPase domain-containing protein [Nonomuraea pusilla]
MSAWRFSRYFLGSAPSITEARRFVTALLRGSPIVGEAELIVSELATNAIRHSASGRFGGRFLVTVQAHPDRFWLGVLDEGGPSSPKVFRPSMGAEGGRGLLLVSTLALDWGVWGDDRGRTVWAVLRSQPQTASCS